MVRVFFSTFLLMPFVLRRIKPAALTRRFLRNIAVAALFMAATSALLLGSYLFIPAGVGIALHYTYPLIVLLLSVLLFHAAITPPVVLAGLLSLGGIIFLCDQTLMPADALWGILMALASAMTYSAYLLWAEHQDLSRGDPLVFTGLLSVHMLVYFLLFNFATGQMHSDLHAADIVMLGAAGMCELLAVITQLLAIRKVGSVFTSILGTLEPIVCTVGTALALNSPVSPRMLGGAALVLSSVVLITIQGRPKSHPQSEAI